MSSLSATTRLLTCAESMARAAGEVAPLMLIGVASATVVNLLVSASAYRPIFRRRIRIARETVLGGFDRLAAAVASDAAVEPSDSTGPTSELPVPDTPSLSLTITSPMIGRVSSIPTIAAATSSRLCRS